MEPSEIIVEDYNPGWPLAFEKLSAVYKTHLNNDILAVHHVGSTSVKGLAAKPVIDIDIVIANNTNLLPVVKKLAGLGYEHRGNLGISDREAFRRLSAHTPVDGSGNLRPKHNLYVCPVNSIALKNHLSLRDFLRSNPEAVMEYSNLKKKLASQYAYNIDLYIEGKTLFITDILRKMGLNQVEIDKIAAENRAIQ